jgi:small redox-active disulfide protein 2
MATEIKVLGTGCQKCANLADSVEKAATELGIDYRLEKVTDIDTIIAYGVMLTPALVVDGEVKSSGRMLSPGQLKKILCPGND